MVPRQKSKPRSASRKSNKSQKRKAVIHLPELVQGWQNPDIPRSVNTSAMYSHMADRKRNSIENLPNQLFCEVMNKRRKVQVKKSVKKPSKKKSKQKENNGLQLNRPRNLCVREIDM
jgi:hypothetical protein